MNSDRVSAAHTTVARRGASDPRHAGRRAEVAAFEAWQRSQRHGPLCGAPLSIVSVFNDIKRLAEAAAPPCEQVAPRPDEPESAERCR